MPNMRILFVAMSDSVHTARWIDQVADCGWDLHLFPSIDFGATHAGLRNVTVHHSFYGGREAPHPSARERGINLGHRTVSYVARMAMQYAYPPYRARALARLIRRLRPDIVHSLEFQHAGYLTQQVRQALGTGFPAWIATNWGSDLTLFGRLPAHRERVRAVLEQCDWYSCECVRDVKLARELGLRGKVLPVLPNAGGFDLAEAESLRSPGPTSARRVVMLKGYQHFAGRALVGVRALERCADLLGGHTVVVYAPSDDVRLAAELFAARTGIETKLLPHGTPHREILAHHGRARVSIGLSIGDAISTSFLEAMMMGSFPIQSDTSCACEWATDGETAMLVPPEDPHTIEAALRRALTDDALVDTAAARNWATAQARLDRGIIQPQAVEFYRSVAAANAAAGTVAAGAAP